MNRALARTRDLICPEIVPRIGEYEGRAAMGSDATLDGGDVLLGFSPPVRELFG